MNWNLCGAGRRGSRCALALFLAFRFVFHVWRFNILLYESPPAETRLTVYRRLSVKHDGGACKVSVQSVACMKSYDRLKVYEFFRKFYGCRKFRKSMKLAFAFKRTPPLRRMSVGTHERMHEQMSVRMRRGTDRQTDQQTDERTNRQMHGPLIGQTSAQTN